MNCASLILLAPSALRLRGKPSKVKGNPMNQNQDQTQDHKQLRVHCLSVRLSETELKTLDAQRGPRTRGAYLRDVWLGRPIPAAVPSLNLQAWSVLARTAGNLNQLTRACNYAQAPELAVLRRELAEFRSALMGARL